jgi:hypothetical protein
MNMIEATMMSIAAQLIETVALIVCEATEDFLNEWTFYQDSRTIDKINDIYDLNNPVKDLVDLKSFMSEGLRSELRYLILYMIKPNIEIICHSYSFTEYHIYKDMLIVLLQSSY